MLATLDPETQREWELITASRIDTPSATELMTFLESRFRALELMQLTQTLKMSTSTPRSSHPMGNKVSKPLYNHVATKLQCALYKESHRLFKCEKFLRIEVKQSLNFVKQWKLCFNSLQPFATNHTCSKQVCYHCHKKHQTLLHRNVSLDQTVEGQQPIRHPRMARAHQPTLHQLSTNRAVLPQKLAHTVHIRADHTTKHYWLKQ